MAQGEKTDETIPVGKCKRGHVYELRSRNLQFGLFVPEAENGFIGIRQKFKSRYLFTEYHWDNGPPFGTVRPIRDLGPLEDTTIEPRENLGTVCGQCGNSVEYVKIEGGVTLTDGTVVPGEWRHLTGDGSCPKVLPVTSGNLVLFKALEKIEHEESERPK